MPRLKQAEPGLEELDEQISSLLSEAKTRLEAQDAVQSAKALVIPDARSKGSVPVSLRDLTFCSLSITDHQKLPMSYVKQERGVSRVDSGMMLGLKSLNPERVEASVIAPVVQSKTVCALLLHIP
jgi:hypothetical protein